MARTSHIHGFVWNEHTKIFIPISYPENNIDHRFYPESLRKASKVKSSPRSARRRRLAYWLWVQRHRWGSGKYRRDPQGVIKTKPTEKASNLHDHKRQASNLFLYARSTGLNMQGIHARTNMSHGEVPGERAFCWFGVLLNHVYLIVAYLGSVWVLFYVFSWYCSDLVGVVYVRGVL